MKIWSRTFLIFTVCSYSAVPLISCSTSQQAVRGISSLTTFTASSGPEQEKALIRALNGSKSCTSCKYPSYEEVLAEVRSNSVYSLYPYNRLTELEAVAIYAYTADYYREINPRLRSGELGEYEPLINQLTSGLKKLPDFVGRVKRTGSLPPGESEKHFPGNTVRYAAFTSASWLFLEHPFGESRFIIHSIRGKEISLLSSNPDEEEVLFLPGTRFKILEKRKSEAGVDEFVMEEVDSE